ncbi:MAG: General secretion pathway protein G [Parcubacteria group bacterium GW2011_GWF2_44_8]|nr:MAG: General secretion pathway protein G [Parcubacteria group bacterium GW2011_GWF2_44_8]
MNTSVLQKRSSGFTLLELLVVISIIALLTAVIAVNALQSGQQSRDAKRQADIRSLQSAVELYKNKNGRYPDGCRGANTWSGQQGTSYACAGGSAQYIIGLAPEFISVLPFEDKLNGLNSGYVYRTNTNGTVYKIMAMNTVESQLVNYTHPLRSCDIRPDSLGRLQNLGVNGVDTSGWCTTATLAANEPPGAATSYGSIPNCRMSSGSNMDGGNGRFERSFGVWGGFEPLAGGVNRAAEVRNTAVVICK